LEFLEASGYQGSGLVFGARLGEYLIIESFFPFPLSRQNAHIKYDRAVEWFGDQVQGVFFCNHKPFLHTAFLEAVQVISQDRVREIGFCRFDRQGRRIVFASLADQRMEE